MTNKPKDNRRLGERVANPSRQTLSNREWVEKNKDYARYLRARTSARSFIRLYATMEDMDELRHMMEDRKKVLQDEKAMLNDRVQKIIREKQEEKKLNER